MTTTLRANWINDGQGQREAEISSRVMRQCGGLSSFLLPQTSLYSAAYTAWVIIHHGKANDILNKNNLK